MKKNRDTDQLMLAGTEEGEILARLNDRVEKAIVTIQELRRERDELRKQVEEMKADLEAQTGASEKLTTLEEDYERFRRERNEIKSRIETILGNLESLDATSESEG